MNKIDEKFLDLQKKSEKALITFITAGYPDLETTKNLILEMQAKGADLIELGVPFSDPIAEGEVIQAASFSAIQNGVTLGKIFELLKDIKTLVKVPLLLMLYANSIFAFGQEKFFKLCKETGVAGVIVPDLPYEEKKEFQTDLDKYGLYAISLVAPTSGARIANIVPDSKGFLYCVSSKGVTGIRENIETDFGEFFKEINKYAEIPRIIGFGIARPEQVRSLKEHCDGVIVGSAIVKLIQERQQEAVKEVGELVASLKQALLD